MAFANSSSIGTRGFISVDRGTSVAVGDGRSVKTEHTTRRTSLCRAGFRGSDDFGGGDGMCKYAGSGLDRVGGVRWNHFESPLYESHGGRSLREGLESPELSRLDGEWYRELVR